MIEWVPIKDWKFEDGQACVICYKMNGKPFFAFINDERAIARYNREGKTVTHIAELNLPVEKTLQEKVNDYLYRIDVVAETKKDLIFNVLEIAKQHYEGEK